MVRDRASRLDLPRSQYESSSDLHHSNTVIRRPSPSPRLPPSPKSSRPNSPSRPRPTRGGMPFARRARYTIFTAVIIVLVIVYVTTGESQTRNSEFYRRTVALMEAKARGVPLQDDKAEFPAQPLHRAGGLHFAEPGGHGKGNHPGEGLKGGVLEEGSKENVGGGIGQAGAQQRPLMAEDDSLKIRLKEAAEKAKKSADDKYRALKDIEAEVEKERGARRGGEDATDHEAKAKKAKDAMSSIIEENARVNAERAQGATASVAASKSSPANSAQSAASKEEEAEQSRLRSLLAEIFSRSPVTIFSKTYCPHSLKGKHILLEAHSIMPKPHVVELDLHPDGTALQGLLAKTTGRRTVPNILVNGKSIGGGDETAMLWKSGELPARIKQMAGRRVTDVKTNFAFGKEPPPSPPP